MTTKPKILAEEGDPAEVIETTDTHVTLRFLKTGRIKKFTVAEFEDGFGSPTEMPPARWLTFQIGGRAAVPLFVGACPVCSKPFEGGQEIVVLNEIGEEERAAGVDLSERIAHLDCAPPSVH